MTFDQEKKKKDKLLTFSSWFWLTPFLIPPTISMSPLRLNFEEAEGLSTCLTLRPYSPGPPHDVTQASCTKETFEKNGLRYHFLLKLLRRDLGVCLQNYVSWASESLYFILNYLALSLGVSFGCSIKNKYWWVDPPSWPFPKYINT